MVKRTYLTGSKRPVAPKSELGVPKKTWDQTFSAETAIKEQFNIKD